MRQGEQGEQSTDRRLIAAPGGKIFGNLKGGVSGGLAATGWKTQLAYEITRLSVLRDLKRRRFILAMLASGASLAVILIGNILKLSGVTS